MAGLGRYEPAERVALSEHGIRAEVILDSISPRGRRLTTLQLRFHRFVLPQFNTHRVFSRNARSSRAVPLARMIAEVRADPALPVGLAEARRGMQPGEPCSDEMLKHALARWDRAMHDALFHATEMGRCGVHQQWANRLLEPYAWSHVVVTATEWRNFFDLRQADPAQSEIRVLANLVDDALRRSQPTTRRPGEWHLPYVSTGEFAELDTAYRASVARCARVSYRDPARGDLEGEMKLYARLLQEKHLSPFEHQATPDRLWFGLRALGWVQRGLHGNFRDWVQGRKLVEAGAEPWMHG